MLRTADPYGTLSTIYAARTPVYAKASLHLPVRPRASIEDTTSSVLELLLTRPTILEEKT